MRSSHRRNFRAIRMACLFAGLFLALAWPAGAVVDFEWTDLFTLFGSAGGQVDVADGMEVFEDPPQGEGVTISYKFSGADKLITKKQIDDKIKEHEPFNEAVQHFSDLIGGGKILMEPPNIDAFLNSHINLAKHGFISKEEYDRMVAQGKNPGPPPPRRGGGLQLPIVISGADLQDPGEQIYQAYSKLDKGWKVIQPVSDIMGRLNALKHQACDSCKSCLDFCGNCTRNEVPDTNDTDLDGDTTEMITVEHHCFMHFCIKHDEAAREVLRNVYQDRGRNHPFYDDASSIIFRLRVKDRTPPRIQSPLPAGPGDLLPRLFMPPGPPSTTGDYTKIDSFTFDDNASDKIFFRFAFGRQFDPEDTVASWGWSGDAPIEVERTKEVNQVFIPNDGLGEMEYTVFAWDKDDNVNPGLLEIRENQPGQCYGLEILGFQGLSWIDDFPLKAPSGVYLSDLSKFGKGKIWVDDNDWPNLMIQLVNKRDRDRPKSILCFPPPLTDPLERPPTIDNDAGSVARLTPPEVFATYEELQSPNTPPYIRVLAAEQGNCPSDPNFNRFLHNPPDPVFIKRHFRFESPNVSDNLPDGTPDLGAASMSRRMGFGSRMVLLCNESLIEDIEYEVNLWAEDNVKWLSGIPGRTIKRPYTGIERLELFVHDPRQRPPLSLRYESGETTAFWMPTPLRAVFREPVTEVLDPAAGESAWDATFPSIEARARDFKGNTRSLKIYFNVTDELSRIRVLEQKHQKN